MPIELKKLDKYEFTNQVYAVFNSTVEDLKAIASNPQSKISDAWLATSALKGIARGDFKAMDWFLTRLGLESLVQQMDLTVHNSIDGSMRDRMLKMVIHSGLLQDPEVLKMIDVTPSNSNNQKNP